MASYELGRLPPEPEEQDFIQAYEDVRERYKGAGGPRVFCGGAAWGAGGAVWGSVVMLAPPGLGCNGALWGAVRLLGDGTGGVKCEEPTRVLRGSCVRGRGSGVGLSCDVGTPQFGVQWGSMGCCEVI